MGLDSAFTILLSGVVAALVAAIFAMSKDQFAFKQRKAEELYIATDVWTKATSGFFITHYPYIKGQISRNDVNDLTIKSDKKDVGKYHSQMVMLTKFYFPKLLDALSKLDQARGSVVDQVIKFEKGKAGLPEFDRAFVAFGLASDSFLEEIVCEGQRYSEIKIFKEFLELLKRSLPDKNK